MKQLIQALILLSSLTSIGAYASGGEDSTHRPQIIPPPSPMEQRQLDIVQQQLLNPVTRLVSLLKAEKERQNSRPVGVPIVDLAVQAVVKNIEEEKRKEKIQEFHRIVHAYRVGRLLHTHQQQQQQLAHQQQQLAAQYQEAASASFLEPVHQHQQLAHQHQQQHLAAQHQEAASASFLEPVHQQQQLAHQQQQLAHQQQQQQLAAQHQEAASAVSFQEPVHQEQPLSGPLDERVYDPLGDYDNGIDPSQILDDIDLSEIFADIPR